MAVATSQQLRAKITELQAQQAKARTKGGHLREELQEYKDDIQTFANNPELRQRTIGLAGVTRGELEDVGEEIDKLTYAIQQAKEQMKEALEEEAAGRAGSRADSRTFRS